MNQRSPYYSLFHAKPLTRRVSSFGFPRDLGDRFQIIQRWLGFTNDGASSNLMAEAQFLHDIFVDILGYKSPFETDGGAWELELHPNPALGFFAENSDHVIAEIRVNAAEEGAIVKPEPQHETTEWLIVLDYRELCLYHRGVSGLFCQRFAWESLEDLQQLKTFYFLLSRRTLLRGIANSEERSRTTQLLEESHQLEAEVLKNFHSHYYKIRSQLIKDFRYRLPLLIQLQTSITSSSNTGDNTADDLKINAEDVIAIAIYQSQKLLNRILFVACCEDRGLLADNLIKDAYEFVNPYIEQHIWENYKAVFRWVQIGNANYHNPINPYPSKLFEQDYILDKALFVGDELCRQIKEISRFGFNEDITRHILTTLFDDSIKELSQYRKDLANLSKRRTPKLPCKAILQSESVIRTLQQHLSIGDRDIDSDRQSSHNNLQNTLAYCKDYQKRLLNIKIVHSKCGAGVFLSTALEFLISEHERIHHLLTKFSPHDEAIAHKTSAEIMTHILQHNLFGCDVLEEAVEITRLSLCLRSLEINSVLPNFEHNIQLGELVNCDFGKDFREASDRGEVIVLK